MKPKQTIALLAVIAAGMLVLIMWLISSALNHKSTPAGSGEISGVTVTNIGQYVNDLGSTTISTIQDTLYQRVLTNYKGAPTNHYDAIVRPGTYTKQLNNYGVDDPPEKVPSVTFMVDIPSVKESYSVSFSGGDSYPYKILYVVCPQPDQLMYGDFNCVDGTN